MVKDNVTSEPVDEADCEQREAIESALRRLGLRADQEGFARLGEEVRVKGATLYKAWLGKIRVSGPVLVALSKVGPTAYEVTDIPGEGAAHKLGEEIGFILRNGSPDQVNLFKALVESVHRQVAESHPRRTAV